MDTKTTFIYALCEPVTRTIRYIGKSDNPERRLRTHISGSSKYSTHLGHWLKLLASKGESPELEILDEIPNSQWQFWEREYIRVFRAIGLNLVNVTEGGDGAGRGNNNPMFGKHHSKNALAKMSTAASARTGEKNSFFGKNHTPETKALIGAQDRTTGSGPGRFTSESALGENNLFFGETHSDETREKMKAKWTPERKKEASAAMAGANNPMFGKRRTEESLRKLKETLARKKLLKEAA